MRSYILVTSTTLAFMAPAVSCWHHRAGRIHIHDSRIFVTAAATHTVIDWQTLWKDQQLTATDTASASIVTNILQGTVHAADSGGGEYEETTYASSSQTAALASGNSPVVIDQPNASASRNSPSSVRITTESLLPNGKKAGLSGYVGVQKLNAFNELAPHISWYSDYTPNPLQ